MTDFPIKTSIIVLIMLNETLCKKVSMCEINVHAITICIFWAGSAKQMVW